MVASTSPVDIDTTIRLYAHIVHALHETITSLRMICEECGESM